MHRQGRSERYVMIQNKNGQFPCYPRDPDTREIDYSVSIPSKLRVCQGCIEKLNYRDFKSKTQLKDIGLLLILILQNFLIILSLFY